MATVNSQWPDSAQPLGLAEGADCTCDEVRHYGLLALVEDHDVSVRLRNSIVHAAASRALPFHTVGDYVDAGSDAQSIMLRDVRNFGRKTARELEALVRKVYLAGTGRIPEATPVNPSTVERTELMALFADETIADVIQDELLSARLSNVLAQPTLSAMRLADVIDGFQTSIATMLRQPNCGRKSVDEFRELCQRHILLRLQQAGYSEPELLVAWLLGGPPPSNIIRLTCADDTALGEPSVASVLPDPFTAPAHRCLIDRLEWLLADLDSRAQQILRRRNGIGQDQCETLEEIGGDLSVTRERIRQIEAKSLKRLRIRVRRSPIASLLLAEGPSQWSALTEGAPLLRRTELHERRRAIDPYVRLALDIEGLAVEHWLDRVAQGMPFGWLMPDGDKASVMAAAARLEAASDAPLPQALATLASPDAAPAAQLAAILVLGRPVRYGYLMPQRVGARLTRLVRLHALLAGHSETLLLEQLVQRYRAIFEDDPCSERDAEIVMDAAPHLFLEIEEGCWSAIGVAGTRLPCANPTEAPIDLRPEEPGTIAHALQLTLYKRGPTRLVDLLDDAAQILPDGRSVNSIGPVLLTRRELFVRALPGVYALPEHIPAYAGAMPEEWPVLFNDGQARLYAIARYAGEPRRIFPLWSSAVEYALCRWARHSGGAGIFSSLLAVAVIDGWPIEPDEYDGWRRQQVQDGRYALGVSLRHEAAYELPALDRVFAACRYAEATGQFNWVAGNRLTGRKIDSHGGAGLVALLIRLGAIEEVASDGYRWQRPHRATPAASTLAARLDAAFGRGGASIVWSSEIGRELAGQATRNPSDNDWVDDAAVAAMFSQSPAQMTIDIEDDDPLAQLLAEQRRARDAERREATLDWLLEE